MTTAPLRACPVCQRSIKGVDLGLRDWSSWLGDTLPGRIGPGDLDWVLERHNHFLIIEFKGHGALVPMGQRLTLKAFKKLGADVWLVQEPERYGDVIKVTQMNDRGNFSPDDMEEFSLVRFRNSIKRWYDWADAN